MDPVQKSEILQLSLPDRIQLVEEIWDSIAAHPEDVAISDAQRAALDERLCAYREDRLAGSDWGAVRDRIRRAE